MSLVSPCHQCHHKIKYNTILKRDLRKNLTYVKIFFQWGAKVFSRAVRVGLHQEINKNAGKNIRQLLDIYTARHIHGVLSHRHNRGKNS